MGHTTAIEQRVRPFYCGSQAVDWEVANCNNCHKGGHYTDDTEREWVWLCEIQQAKDAAFMGDGTVSAPIAARMGCTHLAHGWRCNELVPIVPIAEYFESLKPPPTKLMPLWKRLRRAWESAMGHWDPWWRPEVDIYGVPGRISLRLAWTLGWILWHDARVRQFPEAHT